MVTGSYNVDWLLTLLFGAIIIRAYQLQMTEQGMLKIMHDRQHIRIVKLPPKGELFMTGTTRCWPRALRQIQYLPTPGN